MAVIITPRDSTHLASLPQHYAICTHTSTELTWTPSQGYSISDMLVRALPCISIVNSWEPYVIIGGGSESP
jgi:hypothetical protein